MTREQTIKSALKYLVRKQQEQGSWGYANNDNTNKVSWNEVLEWIDQQPCGDLISRQAAFDEIIWNSDNGVIDAKVAIEALRKLPSVEPERKTGKWVGVNPMVDTLMCSECGENIVSEEFKSNYCPNCGAKMEVKV